MDQDSLMILIDENDKSRWLFAGQVNVFLSNAYPQESGFDEVTRRVILKWDDKMWLVIA